MRAWLILMVLLAGCSDAPPAEAGPESPLYTGKPVAPVDTDGEPVKIKHVPMDPVSGVVAGDGIVDRHCAVLSGGGNFLTAWTMWSFDVGSNATSLDLTATWDPTNPTIERLGFDLIYRDSLLTTVEGAPGFVANVGVQSIEPDDRRITVRLAAPHCGSEPVAVRYYQGVEAKVDVTFKP